MGAACWRAKWLHAERDALTPRSSMPWARSIAWSIESPAGELAAAAEGA